MRDDDDIDLDEPVYDGWLVSRSFTKRSLAVVGHNIVGSFLIYLPALALAVASTLWDDARPSPAPPPAPQPAYDCLGGFCLGEAAREENPSSVERIVRKDWAIRVVSCQGRIVVVHAETPLDVSDNSGSYEQDVFQGLVYSGWVVSKGGSFSEGVYFAHPGVLGERRLGTRIVGGSGQVLGLGTVHPDVAVLCRTEGL